jgi:hypothetical protein
MGGTIMYKISKETIEATLNYLASKPYIEVYSLIQKLQAVESIEESSVGDNEE